MISKKTQAWMQKAFVKGESAASVADRFGVSYKTALRYKNMAAPAKKLVGKPAFMKPVALAPAEHDLVAENRQLKKFIELQGQKIARLELTIFNERSNQ